MADKRHYVLGGNVRDPLETRNPSTKGKPWADKLFIISILTVGIATIVGLIAHGSSLDALGTACVITIVIAAPLALLAVMFGTK